MPALYSVPFAGRNATRPASWWWISRDCRFCLPPLQEAASLDLASAQQYLNTTPLVRVCVCVRACVVWMDILPNGACPPIVLFRSWRAVCWAFLLTS